MYVFKRENCAEGQFQRSRQTTKQTDRKMFHETLFGVNGHFDFTETQNVGFRNVEGEIFTYKLAKNGLSPLYFKREVLNDLINTTTIIFD